MNSLDNNETIKYKIAVFFSIIINGSPRSELIYYFMFYRRFSIRKTECILLSIKAFFYPAEKKKKLKVSQSKTFKVDWPGAIKPAQDRILRSNFKSYFIFKY